LNMTNILEVQLPKYLPKYLDLSFWWKIGKIYPMCEIVGYVGKGFGKRD